MDQILFYVFAAVAALAGLLAVSRKNAVASACWLVVMFFGLAAVYVLLEAYFVAAVQILVYAGAIMVLFLFVIMLLDLRTSELAAHRGPKLRVAGVALSIVFVVTVLHALRQAAADVKVADRLTAVLRLPPPPPAEPKDALEVPTLPIAPPPVDVDLHEVAPERATTELGEATGEGRGDRAYAGTLELGGGRPAAALRVVVSPDGSAEVAIGGTTVAAVLAPLAAPANPSAPADPTAALTSRVDVPGVAGASVELVLQRGGLEPRLGGGPDGSPRAIGRALYEDWLLPFEIASLLLTGAIFGAVVLTKRRLP